MGNAQRGQFPSYAESTQHVSDANHRANAPIRHGQGRTFMSEKVKRIFPGVIATVYVHRILIKNAENRYKRARHVLPLAPKPPNGSPGAES